MDQIKQIIIYWGWKLGVFPIVMVFLCLLVFLIIINLFTHKER